MKSVHENHKSDSTFERKCQLKSHVERVHEINSQGFKCKLCESIFKSTSDLNSHIASVHKNRVSKPLKVASLNINKGLFTKEELLLNTIHEQSCEICYVSEIDIKEFDENKPFTLNGYQSFFPLQKPGSSAQRLVCFVKNGIEVTKRTDLMSNLFTNVWLEVKGTKQKVLICALYREFSDLTGEGQMTPDQQLERFEIFHSQVELAQKEGTILCLGDFNINLENLENPSYYLKKLADEYLTMVGELGLEILDYGVTWNRIKNGSVVKSAVDHAITNKP